LGILAGVAMALTVGAIVGVGGNQPAHQSMINRRFMIVPPALPSGHAEQLEEQAKIFCACCLKRRT
jgi:hypothetical protein